MNWTHSFTNDDNHQIIWSEKYRPKISSDLIVNNKKINEVKNWIEFAEKNLKFKILLLTGPSGCGKLSTVTTIEGISANILDGCDTVSDFNDFLWKSSRYEPLQEVGNVQPTNKQLLIIKELPNKMYLQPELFHESLKSFAKYSRSLLVLILTDENISVNYTSYKLCPPELQTELFITQIKFNSIPPTVMVKYLTKIVNFETKLASNKIKALVQSIVNNANGDVRYALNELQFRLTLQNNKESANFDSNKDEKLFLFHALGKILYNKRETDSKISENERPPLKYTPEEVFQSSGLSSNQFIDYLQANYLQMSTDIYQIVEISKDFVASEQLTRFNSSGYDNSFVELSNQIGLSLATRSYLWNNTKLSENRFRQFNKSVVRDIYQRCQLVNQLSLDKLRQMPCDKFGGYVVGSKLLTIELLCLASSQPYFSMKFNGITHELKNLLKFNKYGCTLTSDPIKEASVDDNESNDSNNQINYTKHKSNISEWTICTNETNPDNVDIECFDD